MSGRRFKPRPAEEAPLRLNVEDCLRIIGGDPAPWGKTYGALFEKIYIRAAKTHGLVDFTQDQINAHRAISRVVLDYVVALATWVDRQGSEPDLKPVARTLASYLVQARDFELQYDFAGRSLADFVRYHCSTYYFQLSQLQLMADKARKVTSPTKRSVVKFNVTMEMELPVELAEAKQYLENHGCKLYFGTGKPSRVTRVSVVETLDAPAKPTPKKRVVVRKRKKRRKT